MVFQQFSEKQTKKDKVKDTGQLSRQVSGCNCDMLGHLSLPNLPFKPYTSSGSGWIRLVQIKTLKKRAVNSVCVYVSFIS